MFFKPFEFPIGSKVELMTVESLNKNELQILKNCQFQVTIEDHDIIQNKLYGVYCKELPGYLIPLSEIKRV